MISYNSLTSILTLVTALGCGTIAGVFFAFSTFVMKALARLPADDGIAAMQSINVAVVNSWFLGAFLGTAAACLLVIVAAIGQWSDSSAIFQLLGAVAYLAGYFLGDDGLQCPVERRAGFAFAGRPGPGRPVGQLSGRLDNLEPRPDFGVLCGGGTLDSRPGPNARMISEAIWILCRPSCAKKAG